MRRLTLILLALPLALALMGASCSTIPPRPTIPKVVEVEVVKFVQVPASLTADCDPVPKRKNDVDEAVRLANGRGASLDECTGRMRKIRALPVSPGKAKP